MLQTRFIPRFILSQKTKLQPFAIPGQKFFSSEHTSSSDSDDEKKPSAKAPAQTDNAKRLNDLLNSMKTETSSLDITPVKLKEKRAQMQAESKKAKENKEEASIQMVAHSVAKVLGGDIKNTESELLMRLLDIKSPTKATKTTDPDDGGNLNDVLVGMKIERKKDKEDEKTRADTVRSVLQKQFAVDRDRNQGRQRDKSRERSFQRKPRTPDSFTSVDLFGGEPLNIFDVKELPPNAKQDTLVLWPKLQERELKLAVTQPPRNYFEKMALWTEQGKLWKFPINNEQGWEEEAKVSFSDHVFLETLLEGWCPTTGPIRHFMELVCVGLSNNYYLSVREKQDHILWFKEYFETKKDLLKEIIIQADESVKIETLSEK